MGVGIRVMMTGGMRARWLMVVVIRVEGKYAHMGDEHKIPRPTAMVHNHVHGSKEKGDDHTEV
jgi:hypothetical protein